MKALEDLIERVVQRTNINLRELDFDSGPYVRGVIDTEKFLKFCTFYGITRHHPLNFEFIHSSLSGSYFLGNCRTRHAVLYKTDVRGDELKRRGDHLQAGGFDIVLETDEQIRISNSFLVKNLVHNFSHDPESAENFFIRDSVSMHHANIHGAPTGGAFLGPFATVDLTTVYDSIIGTYAYVNAGEVNHLRVDPGTVWIEHRDRFKFLYRYPPEILGKYVHFQAGQPPQGVLPDFVDSHEDDFQRLFDVVDLDFGGKLPADASLDRYAVVKPRVTIGRNVLVAQRAYLENAHLGDGANAQENCFLIDARLEGNNVMAHGAKVIHARLGEGVFVGFNSFLRGSADCPLRVGTGSVVLPHTIVDLVESVTVPDDHLVWGHITCREDLQTNCLALAEFSAVEGEISRGRMRFRGSGAAFVDGFRQRIEHILEANGAFFDGRAHRGHAQEHQNISINTIRPYLTGEQRGIYPTIVITP